MKLGLVGLTGAGKATLFEALTKTDALPGQKNEDRLAAIRVPDNRVDALSRRYQPRKTTYAQINYFLPAQGEKKDRETQWNAVKECDALIHVVRNFDVPGLPPAAPQRDITALEEEFILSDLVVAEKRRERIAADKQRGKKVDAAEATLLEEAQVMLENGEPLRNNPEIAASPLLRGFSLVSAKPVLILINNADDDADMPDNTLPDGMEKMMVRGRLEHEISRMSNQEAEEFLKEFNIGEPATDRAIKQSYDILGLISFFTVGEDEVRAWTIKEGTPAVQAAGVIHSDMQKGFIRAEVVAYDDLMRVDNYAAARKLGVTRLEGKTYAMVDGDIVNFRFNV
jgi:ribosome-binding ATPase